MKNSNENDFDRVANKMQSALNEFVGEMHPQCDENSDSITITKKGALIGIVKMQRAINWCKGHAATRHAMSHLTTNAVDPATPRDERGPNCGDRDCWQCNPPETPGN